MTVLIFFADVEQLPSGLKDKCEDAITEEELGSTLLTMKNGSSPGPDGFSAAFYKIFWNELKSLLGQVATEFFVNGSVPQLFNYSRAALQHLFQKRERTNVW